MYIQTLAKDDMETALNAFLKDPQNFIPQDELNVAQMEQFYELIKYYLVREKYNPSLVRQIDTQQFSLMRVKMPEMFLLFCTYLLESFQFKQYRKFEGYLYWTGSFSYDRENQMSEMLWNHYRYVEANAILKYVYKLIEQQAPHILPELPDF